MLQNAAHNINGFYLEDGMCINQICIWAFVHPFVLVVYFGAFRINSSHMYIKPLARTTKLHCTLVSGSQEPILTKIPFHPSIGNHYCSIFYPSFVSGHLMVYPKMHPFTETLNG